MNCRAEEYLQLFESNSTAFLITQKLGRVPIVDIVKNTATENSMKAFRTPLSASSKAVVRFRKKKDFAICYLCCR